MTQPEQPADGLAFYKWRSTIERDVLVWDLTDDEIAGLIAALSRPTLDPHTLEEAAKVAESFPCPADTAAIALAKIYHGQRIADAIRKREENHD